MPVAAAATTLNEHFCLCGQCGGDLSLQAQKQSTAVARYLVCAACSLSLSLPVKGALTPLAESCPVCHFQLVQVGAEGEGFVVCPFCYNNPPFEGFSHMGCNECLHPSCKFGLLANGVCP